MAIDIVFLDSLSPIFPSHVAYRAACFDFMLRPSLAVLVVLSLAACSSAPPEFARVSGAALPSTGSALRTMPSGSPRFVDHSTGREEISIQAMSLVGVPYRWGGNTPTTGFDCSGLVRYVVARAADVNLPRTTADISRRGEPVEPGDIAPGDLIFFNTTGRPHSHVGIYVGKLRFVNAPSTGGTVRLDYLTNAYWARRFDGIRRVAPALERQSPFDAPTELATRRAPAGPAGSEPPLPPAMTTAQARSGGPLPDGFGSAPVDAATSPRASITSTMAAASPASADSANQATDPIDSAADTFEPPPPSAVQAALQAERQAQRASTAVFHRMEAAEMMRTSGGSRGQRASTATADDPIAQFANGGE